MLKSITLNNCYVFNKEVNFSLKADMRIKKMNCNIIPDNNNILKSAVIYGGNNTGKTNFVKSINDIKNILLNNRVNVMSNIYNNDNISCYLVRFIIDNHEYEYQFKINTLTKKYIYESLSEIKLDKYKNEKENNIFYIDRIKKKYICIDKKVADTLPFISDDNILIYVLDVSKFSKISFIKDVLLTFANSLIILNNKELSDVTNTIDILKKKDKLSDMVKEFILKSDVYLDKIELLNKEEFNTMYSDIDNFKEKINPNLLDNLRLVSVYKDKVVPSILFDSDGTKKIISLASYVTDALLNNKTLIIDELDSSLHFKIVREIVSLFNNEFNHNAQLIVTVHDVSLLDCKYIFRKDQIWFFDRINNENDKYDTILYPLSSFNCNDDKIRSNTDLYDKLCKGLLGAIPNPDLINYLVDINVD